MFFSSLSLIISNLVPLFGILFFGWSIYPILIAYWLENLVIGYFTFLKILLSKGRNITTVDPNRIVSFDMPTWFVLGFFSIHYSLFCLVHGIFLFTNFLIWANFNTSDIYIIIIMAISIFISHWVSYHYNYLAKKEYLKISPRQQMGKPYPRIMIMHAVVLIGGMVLFGQEFQLLSAVALILLKTIFDLGAHMVEHKNV